MADNSGENTGRDGSGKFTQGNPGKPKGAASNASAKVKNAVVEFLERNTGNIQESFDKLKPAEKLKFIADILPYAAPKLSSVQTEHSGEVGQRIEITWNDPRDTQLPDTEDKGSAGVV